MPQSHQPHQSHISHQSSQPHISSPNHQQFQELLQSYASPEKKQHDKIYFNSPTLGLRVPHIRDIAKQYAKNTSMDTLTDLLYGHTLEEKMLATFILIAHYKKNKSKIVHYVLNHLHQFNDWPLTDALGPKIIGPYVLETHETNILYSLQDDSDVWVLRLILVSNQPLIKNSIFEPFIYIANHITKTLHPMHPMIQKAIGWMLKEISIKNQQPVIEFIQTYKKVLTALTIRTALEKFSKSDRQNLTAQIKEN